MFRGHSLNGLVARGAGGLVGGGGGLVGRRVAPKASSGLNMVKGEFVSSMQVQPTHLYRGFFLVFFLPNNNRKF